jgi:hypothetical protein
VDQFLTILALLCGVLVSRLIWGFAFPGMTRRRRVLMATFYAAAGAGLFYLLWELQAPVAASIMAVVCGGYSLLVLFLADPMLQFMEDVEKRHAGGSGK